MIWILISAFGLMSVKHSCDEMVKQKMISHDQGEVLEFILLVLMFISCLWLKSNHFLLLPVTFSAIILPWVVMRYLSRSRKESFQRHFVTLLDDLILAMRAGNSLRDSLKQAANLGTRYQKWMIREVMVRLSHQRGTNEPYLCDEMKYLIEICIDADKKGHRTVDALKAVREQSRLVEDFRRRSRQLSAQINLQSNFSIILYLLLVILMISWRGVSEMWVWVGLSSLMMAAGVMLIKVRKTWKSKI